MRKMFPGCGAGDGMPHGSDQTDLSDYIVILDELMEDLKQERLNGAIRRMQIEKSIRALSDENEAEVLRLRYIKNKKWEEIALEMGYAWAQIHRIHSQIEKSIRALSDENEAEVLRLRYIKNKKWEEIALEMGYAWAQIHRIHSSALKNLKMIHNDIK